MNLRANTAHSCDDWAWVEDERAIKGPHNRLM
jgi:hypothetical protein